MAFPKGWGLSTALKHRDAQPHPHNQTRGGAEDRQLRGPVRGRQAAPVLHFDDIPGRRLRPDILSSEQVWEQAKAYARAERDKARERHNAAAAEYIGWAALIYARGAEISPTSIGLQRTRRGSMTAA